MIEWIESPGACVFVSPVDIAAEVGVVILDADFLGWQVEYREPGGHIVNRIRHGCGVIVHAAPAVGFDHGTGGFNNIAPGHAACPKSPVSIRINGVDIYAELARLSKTNFRPQWGLEIPVIVGLAAHKGVIACAGSE